MSLDAVADPRTEYTRRIAAHQAITAACDRIDLRYSIARGATFLIAAGIFAAALATERFSPAFALPFIAAFVVLVVLHGRLLNRLEQTRRAESYYTTALARLDNRWAGVGADGQRYLSADHPYAADLDLFGRG